jgi:hypothetical protein
MTRYDVTDEAVVNASPEMVFDAIADVFNGRANWWLPHLSSKLRGGVSRSEVGALFDVTVHTLFPLRFTGKTAEIQRPESCGFSTSVAPSRARPYGRSRR